jgi:hypothetical protein
MQKPNKHTACDGWLTCAQYARRVPQRGYSVHEPLHQYDLPPEYPSSLGMLLMVCRARQEGIHQDLASSRNWFLDHGSVNHGPQPVISLRRPQLTARIGVIGYIVKLIHIPVNNILVGGS